MLAFIDNVLQGLLIFFGFIAVILFRVAAIRVPSPTKGEPQREAFGRLWKVYRAMWRTLLENPYFWAFSGLVTAGLIFLYRP